ncbi:MAG: hypothetical protein QM844_00930 [Planctomycetota bacterium]|jgi:predicted HicB family RNase H-like nuclease|nr:hypothetical protein [Planctomycetota bacterium]
MTEIANRSEAHKDRKIHDKAFDLFSKKPTWVAFFREVLGVGGIVRTMYPTPEAMAEFERTDTYASIQQMLTELREQPVPTSQAEPTRVITVRIPKSVHDLLRTEAFDYRTSMNKLCISKLLQFIDTQFVPDPYGSLNHEDVEEKGAGVDL